MGIKGVNEDNESLHSTVQVLRVINIGNYYQNHYVS